METKQKLSWLSSCDYCDKIHKEYCYCHYYQYKGKELFVCDECFLDATGIDPKQYREQAKKEKANGKSN